MTYELVLHDVRGDRADGLIYLVLTRALAGPPSYLHDFVGGDARLDEALGWQRKTTSIEATAYDARRLQLNFPDFSATLFPAFERQADRSLVALPLREGQVLLYGTPSVNIEFRVARISKN